MKPVSGVCNSQTSHPPPLSPTPLHTSFPTQTHAGGSWLPSVGCSCCCCLHVRILFCVYETKILLLPWLRVAQALVQNIRDIITVWTIRDNWWHHVRFRCYVIHSSCIQAISIAPLQAHYYSEALPTQHGICTGVSRRSSTGICEWRTCPRFLRGS